jgi:hypothetical protein
LAALILARAGLRGALAPRLDEAQAASLYGMAELLGEALDGWCQRVEDARGGGGFWTRAQGGVDAERARVVWGDGRGWSEVERALGPLWGWFGARWEGAGEAPWMSALWQGRFEQGRAQEAWGFLPSHAREALWEACAPWGKRALYGVGVQARAGEARGLALVTGFGEVSEALGATLGRCGVEPEARGAWAAAAGGGSVFVLASAGVDGGLGLEVFSGERVGAQGVGPWRAEQAGLRLGSPPTRFEHLRWSP